MFFLSFQSTHSRGVRRNELVRSWIRSGFQSTHSRGVRLLRSLSDFLTEKVSIHALTRSATSVDTSFQYRTARFNPRTHEECDHNLTVGGGVILMFQSTHSRGVRQNTYNLKDVFKGVSIHALTRSATYLIFRMI